MKIFNEKLPQFTACLLGFILVGGFMAAQSNHWGAVKEQKSRSEFNRFVDQKLAEYDGDTRHRKVDNKVAKTRQFTAGKLTKTKPVALFKPKSERERQEVIASIWGLEGKTHETKIFTARRD